MDTKADNLGRTVEAHNKIRQFASRLQIEEGYTATMLCDALIAAGVNAAVLIAGREATASCLAEWVGKVRNLAPDDSSQASH